MSLKKPDSVARDSAKSAKWDEITVGREFDESDAPTLTLLVHWYSVVQRCIDDMEEAGGQVAYENNLGDLKALPQLSTMKQASAEIRALNKQLGIVDGKDTGESKPKKETKLYVIQANREARRAKAANTA